MNKKKVILGIIIIALGIFFLLENFGFVDFSVLWRIRDIWPLLLVAIGFSIIFKDKPRVLYAIWIIFLIIVILYGVHIQSSYNVTRNNSNTRRNNNDSYRVSEDFRVVDFQVVMEKAQETQYGELDLDIGASEITIDKEDDKLVIANISGRDLEYKEEYRNNMQTAEISFESPNVNGVGFKDIDSAYYDFYLNKDVIWDLDLDLGAISGEFNLKDIPVRTIDLDFGAGELDFVLGELSPELIFDIDTGASSLNITVPKDAGIKIDIDAALTSIDIGKLGLTKVGNNYISNDYENANTKIEFNIDMGAGSINFDIGD